MELPFSVKEFFNNFLIYHYLFFGFLFLFAILLLVLGIVFRRKSFLAFLFYFSSFASAFIGPFAGSYYLEEYLRATSLEEVKVTRLTYTKAIVLSAKLKNNGRTLVNTSYISLSLVKKDDNSIKEFINILRPEKIEKKIISVPLAGKEHTDIRIVLDISDVKEPQKFSLFYQLKSF